MLYVVNAAVLRSCYGNRTSLLQLNAHSWACCFRLVNNHMNALYTSKTHRQLSGGSSYSGSGERVGALMAMEFSMPHP